MELTSLAPIIYFADIALGSRSWLPIALIGGFLGLVLIFWSYRGVRGPHRIPCILLKLAGISLLALCLLEPLWTSERPKSGANLFVVMADNSRSVATPVEKGAKPDPSALTAAMRAVLEPTAANEDHWLENLGRMFQLRRYLFDSRPRRVTDFIDLDAQGEASDLAAALKSLASSYADRPLAGIVLLTDGAATDAVDLPVALEDLPPIYPVLIDPAPGQQDLSLADIAVAQSPFEDAPVTINANLRTRGEVRGKVDAVVRDHTGAEVARQSVELKENGAPVPLRFRVQAEGTGLMFYNLEVESSVEERTVENNQATVAVDRGGGPFRILYVAGRPNWDYKFLSRSVAEDDQLSLVGLVRLAKREPKFVWHGRSGETGNPLFRGFEGDADEEASYDQPILTRLGVRDGKELVGGFPKVAEDLFDDYHAIILDDVEAGFFTYDQMRLMREFVSRRGGGFLMLGGAETFHGGNYAKSPIGEMIPAFVDGNPQGDPAAIHRYDLTREGWLEPWTRLRDRESEDRTRLNEMPSFFVVNPVGSIRPGSNVLASVQEEGDHQSAPALLSQRFGRGRAAAFAVGDLWRWGMVSKSANEDQAKAWRQMLRWLVADVPERLALRVPDARIGQPVEVVVEARDAAFLPDSLGRITVQVTAPDGSALELVAEADLEEPGTYQASFFPQKSGAYEMSASGIAGDGEPFDPVVGGFALNPALEEFRPPDLALLETMATITGGRVVDQTDLAELVNELQEIDAPVKILQSTPLWHNPWTLLLALLLLISEWYLRRRAGLS